MRGLLRTVFAATLSGAARGLAMSARALDQVAVVVRPGRPTAADGPGPVGPITTDEVVDAIDEQREDTAARVDEEREAADVLMGGAPAEPYARLVGPEPLPEPGKVTGREAPAEVAGERVREPETHVAELADRTAAEVVASIGSLSTDELRRLYEHESANKQRKTVLQAIEAAVDPTNRRG